MAVFGTKSLNLDPDPAKCLDSDQGSVNPDPKTKFKIVWARNRLTEQICRKTTSKKRHMQFIRSGLESEQVPY
jgi:hypothetical protein